METLSTAVWLGNTAATWVVATASALAVGLGLRLLRDLVVGRLEALAKRTATTADDTVVDVLKQTRTWAAYAVAVWVFVAVLSLPPDVEDAVRKVVGLVLIAQAVLWGTTLVRASVDRFVIGRGVDDAAVKGAKGVVSVVAVGAVWIIGALVALANLGVDVTAGIAGLGIGGVAVALALQNVLGDLFASLAIVLDRPFLLGEFIVVGDEMGAVEHVGLKTTRVRSLSGEQIVFGNADLLKARIRNFGRLRERRVKHRIGVAYETPPGVLRTLPGLVGEIVVAQGRGQVRLDHVHVVGFDDSAIAVEVVWFVTSADNAVHMDVQQDVLLTILEAFAARGVELAYPTRTLWVRGPSKEGPVTPTTPPSG